jgi:hypothetical protein
MVSQSFSRKLSYEHRVICNVIVDLGAAFVTRNLPVVRAVLDEAAGLVGIYLRYLEEELFPVLNESGQGTERMLDAHDQIIGTLKRLMLLAQRDRIGRADANEASRLVELLLQCLSINEGLSDRLALLPAAALAQVEQGRAKVPVDPFDLVEWADGVRGAEMELLI